ncbi:MAG: hypothetical protein ACTHNM_17230 [Dyella sp.]|uniref:hypothetical protein n=1 Tax=Dyella sp. TaxID=1869338 RepID=UPI003F8085F2
MDWNSLNVAASVVSAICAVIAATVSVVVFFKARSGDFSTKIERGDMAQKKHTDRAVTQINSKLSQQDERMGEIEDSLARIEQQQQHNLTARDLGPLHEKINGVALQLAANTAATKASSEQLGVIHRLLMEKRT